MNYFTRSLRREISITCPHCKFTNKVDVTYVEDAIHDDLQLTCVVCNEHFKIVTVGLTRDAQLRNEAEAVGQETACAWDNVSSPNFDGCNGCEYACALGLFPKNAPRSAYPAPRCASLGEREYTPPCTQGERSVRITGRA